MEKFALKSGRVWKLYVNSGIGREVGRGEVEMLIPLFSNSLSFESGNISMTSLEGGGGTGWLSHGTSSTIGATEGIGVVVL